jgi:predicted glycoside hydrolase/deacetylase ChbG (UPF0249 family)
MQLIVNADDFGLCPEVNAAVERAFACGLLRSASLLVTGPSFAEACAIARRLPGLSVGLHVALVHEPTACVDGTRAGLCGQDGRLPARFTDFLRGWWTRRISPEDVSREVSAQLRLMCRAGLRPTHLDSHQHLHLLPGVFDICLHLCREYDIPFIRVPGRGLMEASAPVGPARRLQFGLVGRLAAGARRRLGEGPPRCVDGVWGLPEAGHQTVSGMVALITRMPDGLHELAVHPASRNIEDRVRYPWGYDWRGELDALCATQVRDAVDRAGARITDFRSASRQGSGALSAAATGPAKPESCNDL